MLFKVMRDAHLGEGQRICKEIAGRTVTVLRAEGKAYCIDSSCYHMGGPIGAEGDIEDVGGRLSITCPWHKHKILLDNGKRAETGLDGCMREGPEAVQRVHKVIVDDGWLWVSIDQNQRARSDTYNERAAEPAFEASPSKPRFGLGMLPAAHDPRSPAASTASTLQLSQPDSRRRDSGSADSGSPRCPAPAPLEPYGGWGAAKAAPVPVFGAAPAQVGAERHRAGNGAPAGAMNAFRQRRRLATEAVLKNARAPVTSLGDPAAMATTPPAPRTAQKRSARLADLGSPVKLGYREAQRHVGAEHEAPAARRQLAVSGPTQGGGLKQASLLGYGFSRGGVSKAEQGLALRFERLATGGEGSAPFVSDMDF
ncbi:unnamed protein product [Pedinophyceae sp. YPF-701]|nr:unnamed protein product [Pedinophyceae sp. YPF-701]